MKAFDMLPAGHDDRLPSIIDVLPPADPVEQTGFAPPRVSRSRIFAQGRIIGHLLPLIASHDDAPMETTLAEDKPRPLFAHAYDEM